MIFGAGDVSRRRFASSPDGELELKPKPWAALLRLLTWIILCVAGRRKLKAFGNFFGFVTPSLPSCGE